MIVAQHNPMDRLEAVLARRRHQGRRELLAVFVRTAAELGIQAVHRFQRLPVKPVIGMYGSLHAYRMHG